MRYVDDVFSESSNPTIGVDFKIKSLYDVASNGKTIKAQIWFVYFSIHFFQLFSVSFCMEIK